MPEQYQNQHVESPYADFLSAPGFSKAISGTNSPADI